MFKIKNILVWEKNNTGMGDLKGQYAPKYELCIYANKGSKRKLSGSRDADIIKSKRTINKLHPTQKPVALMEYLIKTYTNENETVLDFTMGSGTTGVACVNTNRNFIGIEKDEKYFEIAENRIKQAVNNKESLLF